MEDRQQQIKERAGLDESRINTELVDWLKRWGGVASFILLALAGAYLLWIRYEQRTSEQLAGAFVSYDAAVQAGDPAGLVRVADENAGQGAVPYLSRLAAAEIHMRAFRTAVPVGETLSGGKLPEGKALLTDEQRQAELKSAETQYRAVLDATKDRPKFVLQTIGALSGLAAIAESKGETDNAKSLYTQAQTLAKAKGLDALAEAAAKRIETLGDIKEPVKLFSAADLPGAQPTSPIITPMTNIQGMTPTGQPVQITPPTPAPAPAPAPNP